jgi:hypothetical protein
LHTRQPYSLHAQRKSHQKAHLASMLDMTKDFKVTIIVFRFVPSSLTNHKILEVTLNVSSKTFICFINLASIVSLASKRPMHTWQGSHCGVKKVSCALLLIHKSNVVVTIGMTSKNGVTYSSKHFSTIIKKIYSFITFREGKTIVGSSCNARHNIQRVSQLLKGKNPLVVKSIRLC